MCRAHGVFQNLVGLVLAIVKAFVCTCVMPATEMASMYGCVKPAVEKARMYKYVMPVIQQVHTCNCVLCSVASEDCWNHVYYW